MAHYGRGRASGNYAASGQYDYPAPPEHNIVRYPQCNVAEIPDDWMQSLKHAWNVFKASEPVKQTVYKYFIECQNPYASALQMMSLCNDFYHSKAKSMASFVIETFATWIAPQEDYYRNMCTRELKNEAFNVVTQQKNIALTRLVFQTFHLDDNATDYLDQIRTMADRKMYKEACQCASLLNLSKYFRLEEMVLPLVLQDKHAIAEEALVQVPEMQKELVVMLDNLLGKKNLGTEVDNLLRELDVPDVKMEVISYPKPLGKLVARLIKKFELPQDLAPNLNKKRTGGALQFLIRKRYKDNLNSESWNEMVKEAVGDDRQLQVELVCTVNGYGDTHEALYWAHYFKIPKDQWPYNVRLLDRDDPAAKYSQPTVYEDDGGSEENWGNEDASFLQLSLPDSALVMVNSVDALNRLIDIFTRTGVTVAGMDSEWKPAFAGRQSELALVQVATREQVFIIDVVNLAGQAPEVWNQLGHCLFRNKDILKLGFDIVNDLQMIKNALPEIGQIKQNGHGYLDLSLLWKRLTNSYKLSLPYRDASKNSTSESLSQLVFLTLGRALNKANQFSNWEQRPLRIGQLRYAALDAFCLLEVYEVLKRCCEEQNIPFLEICDEIMLNYKGPRKSGGNSNAPKKKSPGNFNTESPSAQKRTLSEDAGAVKTKSRRIVFQVNDFEESTAVPWPDLNEVPAGQRPLILPADLRGVARFLRSLGVDVEILECPGSDIVVQARAAVAAGRRVACRGRNYRQVRIPHGALAVDQLAALVPQGYCYNVKAQLTSDQVTEILSAFNIVVSPNDVFSRCQACNSNEFLKISSEAAKFLHESRTGSTQSVSLAEYSKESTGCESLKDFKESDGETMGTSAAYRAWKLIDEPPQLMSDCKTSRGVLIQVRHNFSAVAGRAGMQIEQVPAALLDQYEHLYVCDMCGKCFWDGGHLKRFVNSTRCSNVLRRGEAS